MNVNATGNNNGSSWADAYTDLQDALSAASPGSEIWVAAGTYRPITPADPNNVTEAERGATFQLRNVVAVYGGFVGTETSRSQRNWVANPTVLSGDINNSGNLDGNSFTVVTGGGTTSLSVLDGFIVTGGNADDASAAASSPRRSGGGMHIVSGSPTLRNLRIIGNSAAQDGGGLFNRASSPLLINVVFSGNVASVGGAIWNGFAGSNPTLTNVTISGNSAAFSGGMRNFSGGDASISNSIFFNNRDNTGTGTARASIDTGGTASVAISFSLVQGCNPGGNWTASCGNDSGNNRPDADPQFVTAVNPVTAPTLAGNLRLGPGSPAMNVGSNAANLSAYDLAGNARIIGGTIDLGAFESPTSVCPTPGGIVRVSRSRTQPGNGLSWASAFGDLQDALRVDGPCEIWVASGSYTPSPDALDREASFRLKTGVAIYGGFAGTETSRNQRDWVANPTVLSGDINNSGTRAGNSFTVVTGSDTDPTAVLDGFIVTGGNADDTTASPISPRRSGGGMYNIAGNPTLANLHFRDNVAAQDGGGMFNDGSSPNAKHVSFSGNSASVGAGIFNIRNSNAVLTNVSFSENPASIHGGGMANIDSSPELTNATFIGNSATGDGGGIYNARSSPQLTNVLFSGNLAGVGGAIWNGLEGANPTLTNVTFSGNSANFSGGMRNFAGGGASIRNSIFFNNRDNSGTGTAEASIFSVDRNSVVISNSLVQGCNPAGNWSASCGTDAGDNLADADPLFIAPVDPLTAPTMAGNLRLQDGSPAVDVGNNAFVAGVLTDLDGNARIFRGQVDLGPYENTPVDLIFRDRFRLD
ncbi:MAG: beta strand repeat-containing protein [Wenzhouxiangella sp.]